MISAATSRASMMAAKPQQGSVTLYSFLLWLQLPLLALLVYGAYHWGERWWQQPLQNVEIQGALKETNSRQLRLDVWQVADGRYVDVDMQAVKNRVEQHPWVHRVEVYRQWPHGLVVRVEEQQPVARWGHNALLNSSGQVFNPGSWQGYEQLPLMSGPEERALSMMEQFRSLSQLLRPLQLKLDALQLEPRGAWTLALSNDIQLLLGRGETLAKVRRFSRIYSAELREHSARIKTVDARYTNGLAVTWKPEAAIESQKAET